ncbi:hypothetical protein HQ393_01645 [Chitinibacter bivalviorum]|uniref:Uncharacterized protein n=1 Tax=Chitinibacter bivalviorum TaxID=2739434 RepID=A0A7H9BEK4_9NEIS|nr:hypothetical protein [Chitinibacter bivalviorum]QLG87049.1 hypothetical protein HQ393_01645 [Chitinibacter bivalviorum]
MNLARPSSEKKPSFPLHIQVEQLEITRKKQLDALFCCRDELSLRIEMVRMNGLALQLRNHELNHAKRHPMINQIIRDLKQLYRTAPREALMLRERLIVDRMQTTTVQEPFQGKLNDSPKPHLSNLAVR